MTFGAGIKQSPNVMPTTYHNPYTPDSVQGLVPGCPTPFNSASNFGWATQAQIPEAYKR